jgi:hypothetical protein
MLCHLRCDGWLVVRAESMGGGEVEVSRCEELRLAEARRVASVLVSTDAQPRPGRPPRRQARRQMMTWRRRMMTLWRRMATRWRRAA